jgi:phosphate-selective porin OprO/OprP
MILRANSGFSLTAQAGDLEYITVLKENKQEGKVKKRFVAAGAALLATALIGQTASAKTLEDILKEKGVITEEDYKAVTKVKPIDYKLGKGFTFTSPDEKFQLTLGGRIQVRYSFFDKENAQDVSQWEVKRARIIMGGYAYSKDLTYKLEIDPVALASSKSYKGLVDAWMNYKIVDPAEIKVGQYKVPWSRQELTSDGALEFVDRSPAVDNFKPDYDTGAMLTGKFAKGFAYYYLGTFGGAGQTTLQNTNDNMLAARVAVNPFGDMAYSEGDLDDGCKPLLSIGADYFRQTITRNTATTYNTVAPYANGSGWVNTGLNNSTGPLKTTLGRYLVNSYGIDGAFKWMGVSVQSEYMVGQADSQALSSNNILRAQSFYAQAGYMVIPKKLEAAFRYSYYDPNRDVSNDTQTEQIGCLSYYFNKHNLKLQGDIGNIHQQNTSGSATNTMQYRLQAQIIF